MPIESAPTPRLAGGRPDKRESILAGAKAVFAEHGYSGASIDTIAKRANVSTRTIYNHFCDKPELFHATIMDSTNAVSQRLLAIIDRHFHKITDLEADLIAFGCDYVKTKNEFAEHFAMMGQIKTEWSYVPPEAARQWREAGPERIVAALAERLRDLSVRGSLCIDDPDRAAEHLQSLVWGSVPTAFEADNDTNVDRVASAVRVFLYGYAGSASTR